MVDQVGPGQAAARTQNGFINEESGAPKAECKGPFCEIHEVKTERG